MIPNLTTEQIPLGFLQSYQDLGLFIGPPNRIGFSFVTLFFCYHTKFVGFRQF